MKQINSFLCSVCIAYLEIICPWTCSEGPHCRWQQAVVISHCPEGFTTGSSSWRSSLWAFQPNLWPQAPAAHARLSLHKAGQPLAGRPARKVLTISLPGSRRPQPPHFWGHSDGIWMLLDLTCLLERWQPPWGRTKPASQFVFPNLDSSVPGQLPSWDIPGLLRKASLCLHNLTFPPQQRAAG